MQRLGECRLRLPLEEDLGFVLVESPTPWGDERIRPLARSCSLAVGPLQTVLRQEELKRRVSQLEDRQRQLKTESDWLSRCFGLLQSGGEMLEVETSLERVTPLILETFPNDQLVLATRRPDASGWKLRTLNGGQPPSEPASSQGQWSELLQTASKYERMVHFADLTGTRFANCLVGVKSLTVAPLAFQLGVLCRLGSRISSSEEQVLRNFELGATLLGYLLKLGHLHGQLVQSFQALQESESQLVQAGKLAAIGQIAAGVAHEMNNPLASIRLALEMTARESNLSRATVISLDSARQALQRCRDVAHELLSFSRQSDHKLQKEEVDVQEIVRRALGLSQELARSRGLEIACHWSPHPLPALVNPGQLQEAVLHLLDNALWACQQGGKKISVSCLQGIEILIQDNGPGVQAGLEEKIFEPFFTTRPMGEATGLGLALSRKIAQSIEGDLKLLETSSEGSTFSLTLPGKESA